ncbi:hypothetical protein KVR01_012513 [Diaporthe batatas]|uniref:uncharacterized protein n=1 Tax=Diaporthe batatas TaxID=748121 RepID=UPI001D03B50E|nr:uncharacterized protein KVR01_012513 [Diaporthe batatas]KAG8157851.1 hypothetical protein KVR01_012513 [Diaporthe batatas]
MPSLPCYVCEFGLPTGVHLMTVSTTSNTASPDPTPAVTVQACSTCETSVFKTSVLGFTPGARCHGCQPSGTEDAGVASMTVGNQEHETISLVGGPALDEVAGGGGSTPAENTPLAPPSASPTYLTAGASRNTVQAGVVGVLAGLMLVA